MTESMSFINKIRREFCDFDNLLRDVSKTILARIVLYILSFCFGTVVVGVFIVVSTNDYFEARSVNQRNQDVVSDRILMEYVQDVILLCRDSIKKNDGLEVFNCDEALKAYSISSKDWPPLDRAKFIKQKAFDAMYLQLKYYVALNKAGEVNIGNDKAQRKRLDFIYSVPGFILMMVIIFLLPLLLVLKLRRYGKQSDAGGA